jgi:hypothetical protein
MAVFWVLIALMMEAARTSETLVNFYQTTLRYNPEDSHLRAHRRENLKFYLYRTVQRKRTRTNIHISSGIRTHDPSVRAVKTYAFSRPLIGTKESSFSIQSQFARIAVNESNWIQSLDILVP